MVVLEDVAAPAPDIIAAKPPIPPIAPVFFFSDPSLPPLLLPLPVPLTFFTLVFAKSRQVLHTLQIDPSGLITSPGGKFGCVSFVVRSTLLEDPAPVDSLILMVSSYAE
jgi:hypothetical protein